MPVVQPLVGLGRKALDHTVKGRPERPRPTPLETGRIGEADAQASPLWLKRASTEAGADLNLITLGQKARVI